MVQAPLTTIALDLASSTGVCVAGDGRIVDVLELTLGSERDINTKTGKLRTVTTTLGRRCALLREGLDHVAGKWGGPYVIVYEEVCRWSGFQAAHIYCALRGITHHWAHERSIPLVSYSPGEIKKHATGKGNADKIAMIQAAQRRWPNSLVGLQLTDNMADAMHIADIYWSKTHADQRLRDSAHI